jgi:hypothetical protein
MKTFFLLVALPFTSARLMRSEPPSNDVLTHITRDTLAETEVPRGSTELDNSNFGACSLKGDLPDERIIVAEDIFEHQLARIALALSDAGITQLDVVFVALAVVALLVAAVNVATLTRIIAAFAVVVGSSLLLSEPWSVFAAVVSLGLMWQFCNRHVQQVAGASCSRHCVRWLRLLRPLRGEEVHRIQFQRSLQHARSTGMPAHA